jgi:hypothetical protein
MFERINQAAERAAAGVSRRMFLGRLGRGALVAAGALGGVLALPRPAEAKPPCPGRKFCGYTMAGPVCCAKTARCCYTPLGFPACC